MPRPQGKSLLHRYRDRLGLAGFEAGRFSPARSATVRPASRSTAPICLQAMLDCHGDTLVRAVDAVDRSVGLPAAAHGWRLRGDIGSVLAKNGGIDHSVHGARRVVRSFLSVTVGQAAAGHLRRPIEAALACLTDDDHPHRARRQRGGRVGRFRRCAMTRTFSVHRAALSPSRSVGCCELEKRI